MQIATDVSEAGKNMTIAPSIDQTPRYPTTTSYQLYTLCHRVFTKTIKDPSLVLLALGKYVKNVQNLHISVCILT